MKFPKKNDPSISQDEITNKAMEVSHYMMELSLAYEEKTGGSLSGGIMESVFDEAPDFAYAEALVHNAKHAIGNFDSWFSTANEFFLFFKKELSEKFGLEITDPEEGQRKHEEMEKLTKVSYNVTTGFNEVVSVAEAKAAFRAKNWNLN